MTQRASLQTIGGRLVFARELRGWDGKPLSVAAKLSPATVHNIENHPDADARCGTILALATVLDVDPAWLAWGRGEMPKRAADSVVQNT